MTLQHYGMFINSPLVELFFLSILPIVFWRKQLKQNLEKIKGAVIYWQSRDAGNIGNKTQNKDIQNNNNNKKHNTED
jgi:hypothetical protein